MADNNFDTYKTAGSFNLGNQITLKNVNSNVDRDYGPYEDKTLDEIADLLKDTIQIGKTIGVIEEGVIREYWWQLVDSENSIYKFILKIGSNAEELLEEYKPGEILETAPNEILEMLFNGEITADDLIETTGSVGVQVVDSKTNYIHFCDIFYKYFWFTALEDNCSIGFYHNPDSSIQPTLEYSFDRYEWNILSDNVSVPKDTNMYVRGINPNGISPGYDDGNYNYFVGEGKFNVSGDIMTLINHKSIPETMVGTFYNLFGGYGDSAREDFVDIVDASNLILSAKTLTSDCYHNMFDSCTSMVYGPQIKATTLAPFCCYKMFYDCTSLTTAPELPATELASECYQYMFLGCTSLTTAPELPSTTLADNCYGYMFQNCTSLTTAPELSATTLAEYCYQYMFLGCTNLTQAFELPATKLYQGCYADMFDGCTSLTTAPELPATELAENCYSGMFRGCTSLTHAPELPATTLATQCYYFMFSGCTSLNYIKCLATDITAYDCTYKWVENVASTGTFIKHPNMNDWEIDSVNGIPIGWTIEDAEIPMPYVTFTAEEDNSSIGLERLSTNQTLEYSTDSSTWNTFVKTTNVSLNNGDKVYVRGILNADNTQSNYTQFKMTGKIAASGNCNAIWDYQDLNAPLKDYCGYYMFYNCTSLTTAPELPSTELAERCYSHMFKDCTSLTTAPELPATTLAIGCYYGMFWSCTSLTTAPKLPATTLADYCYSSMFIYCTSLTTAPELPATTLAAHCYYCMFQGCTGLTQAPELPATKLVDSCYESMFYRCTNINYIKCLASIIVGSCTHYWVYNVAPTGTFIKHPDMNDWSTGVSGIPSGWTIEDYTE